MGTETMHDGFLTFTDSSGNRIQLDGMTCETTFGSEDNDQENTQVSLDDMINESVDVYERRRDGENDAAYEDVDVHFRHDHVGEIHITDHAEGGFTAQVDGLNLDFLNQETGDIGAFTLHADTEDTMVATYNITSMEERITCLENEVYGDSPDIDSMLMRIGNLEAYLASTNDSIKNLKDYLHWVMCDIQQLQIDTNSENFSDYPNLEGFI